MPQSNRTRWPFEPHDFGRYEAHHRREAEKNSRPSQMPSCFIFNEVLNALRHALPSERGTNSG